MNNPRNFSNDISNKDSFISLKDEINKKIKETLFDQNLLFLSSSFNYFCSNYKTGELLEEAKNISNLLDNLSTLNEEEKIENNILQCNSPTPTKEIVNGSCNDVESKKKSNESEDERSSSFGSKFTKSSQLEENKQKLNICLVNYPKLITLLDIKKDSKTENEINLEKINIKNIDKNAIRERIKNKIIKLGNEIENNKNVEIKNKYLRKMVCLKLYKALHFALKNFDLDEDQIKHICLYIEIQGRLLDMTMGIKYKEFIENVLKRISAEKI